MELLLFLSALLSALTGAVSSTRAPEAPVQQSGCAVAASNVICADARAPSVRASDHAHLASRPALADTATALLDLAVARVARTPIYLDKPRN